MEKKIIIIVWIIMNFSQGSIRGGGEGGGRKIKIIKIQETREEKNMFPTILLLQHKFFRSRNKCVTYITGC